MKGRAEWTAGLYSQIQQADEYMYLFFKAQSRWEYRMREQGARMGSCERYFPSYTCVFQAL